MGRSNFDYYYCLPDKEKPQVGYLCSYTPIVAKDIYTGLRELGQLVAEKDYPWEALAELYLERAPYARMKELKHRLKFIHHLVDDYKVDGVIAYSLKFCDPELMFYPFLKADLERKAIFPTCIWKAMVQQLALVS